MKISALPPPPVIVVFRNCVVAAVVAPPRGLIRDSAIFPHRREDPPAPGTTPRYYGTGLEDVLYVLLCTVPLTMAIEYTSTW